MALSDEAQKAAAAALVRPRRPICRGRSIAWHTAGFLERNVMQAVGILLAAAIVGGLIDRFLLS